MKKIIFFATGLLILISLLAACSIGNTDHNTPASELITPNPTVSAIESTSSDAKIIVNSPMTMSFNYLYPINGKDQYLMLRMLEGVYYEDWDPGPLFGRIWEGKYTIEMTDENFNTIAHTDLSEFFTGSLIFTSSFDIQFDDYNNDGDPDFTLGQYATSNGNDFKLFTLRKDGSVELLPIKDFPSLFISNSSSYYSTKLIKVSDTEFCKQYYDNVEGKSFEDIFRWDGEQFLHVDSKIITEYKLFQ